MKKPIPILREREGNEKKTFPKFGNGKGMKKSIPIIWERESEAFNLGNGREREFPLTPVEICAITWFKICTRSLGRKTVGARLIGQNI